MSNSPFNQPREKVELTIRATSGGRVQDTFDLIWIPRFGSITMPRRCNLNPLGLIIEGHAF